MTDYSISDCESSCATFCDSFNSIEEMNEIVTRQITGVKGPFHASNYQIKMCVYVGTRAQQNSFAFLSRILNGKELQGYFFRLLTDMREHDELRKDIRNIRNLVKRIEKAFKDDPEYWGYDADIFTESFKNVAFIFEDMLHKAEAYERIEDENGGRYVKIAG